MASTNCNARVTSELCKNTNAWSSTVERLKLKQRTCKTFREQEIDQNRCICNRPRSAHNDKTEKDSINTSTIWNWKKDTEEMDADCFSELPHSNAPYLRCDIKTNLDQICLLLLGVPDMHIPKMIINMIGESTTSLNIKLEEELLKGIAHAAEVSEACIITSCYKEDNISQIIGEVTYKNRLKNNQTTFRSIGVGKWGNIRDRPTNQTESVRSGRKTLESNLTHYIFFDDGTHDSIDNGKFASALAKQMSCGARRKIPLIATLAGGNLYAIELMYRSLKSSIPVVIIDESGPLANKFCRYLKLTQNKTSKSNYCQWFNDDEDGSDLEINDDALSAQLLDQYIRDKTLRQILSPFGNLAFKIIKDLRKFYEITRQEEYAVIGKRLPMDELLNIKETTALAKYIFWFTSCLSKPYRELIYVYDFNSTISFQNKIYHALIKAQDNLSQGINQHSMLIDDRIELACRWKISDIAETHLQNVSIHRKDKKNTENNRNLIHNALTNSRSSVILINDLFKAGIDFTVLLDENTLENYLKNLYFIARSQHIDEMNLLKKIDKDIEWTREMNLCKNLTRVLTILVGDFMEPIYSNVQKPEDTNVREYIYRDLFLWCILTRQLNLGKVFLSQMKIRLCSALIASKILRSFIKYAPDERSQDQLSSEADDFENIAIECIHCSYVYDHGKACELIMRQIDMYGEITCLQMAVIADAKKFLHEDACQALLTNIWYDKINPAQERRRLFVNLLTMGVAQFGFSLYDKRKEQQRKQQQQQQHAVKTTKRLSLKRPLKKYGVNYTDDYHNDESIFKHFIHFHTRPIVKYFYTCFGYALFLLFFSYFLLYSFDPISEDKPDIHWTEILTIIFVASMLFEEIRQYCSQDDVTWKGKFFTYFDLNNQMSNLFLIIPSFLLFIIGIILRFTIRDPDEFAAARIIMAYDLELWFIRSILFIGIARNLGPKLVMIRKMTSDLVFFVFLILTVIFAYGIASRSMIAYGTLEFDGRNFFSKIVYPVYYFVLGSFDGELQSLDETPDAGTTIATQVMFAFHMLFVNILLVNLLIALFTFTIDNIQEQAKYIWAYDRCSFVRDYYYRPALFPPLTFFTYLISICHSRWRAKKQSGNEEQHHSRCFKMIPDNSSLNDAWSEFERYSTNDYIRRLIDTQIIASLKQTSTNTESETEVSSDFKEEFKQNRVEFSRLNEKLTLIDINYNRDLSDRVEKIEDRLDEIIHSLDWMMKAMERVKMNKNPPMIVDKKLTPDENSNKTIDKINNDTILTNTQTGSRKISLTKHADIRIMLEKSPDKQETETS